jgi:hypothetical protein
MESYVDKYIQLSEVVRLIAESNKEDEKLRSELDIYPIEIRTRELIHLCVRVFLSAIREDANRELQFLRIDNGCTENDLSLPDGLVRDSAIKALSAIANDSRLIPVDIFYQKHRIILDFDSAKNTLQVYMIKEICARENIDQFGGKYCDLYDSVIPSDTAISAMLSLHEIYFYRDKLVAFIEKAKLVSVVEKDSEVIIPPKKVLRKNADPEFMLRVIKEVLGYDPVTVLTGNQARGGREGFRSEVINECLKQGTDFTKGRGERAWESLRNSYRNRK